MNPQFVTCRPRPNDNPKLVLVQSEISHGLLKLSAKGMDRKVEIFLEDVIRNGNVSEVKLWRDRPIEGYDCGSEISDWLGELFSSEPGQYRLLYYRSNLRNSRLIKEDEKYNVCVDQRRNDKAVYADLAPYLLTTCASLDDLNTKLEKKLTMRSFRPNIVVRGPDPYEEHTWSAIKIGDSAHFLNIKPCGRCLLTTVDPDTAEVNKKTEPLATLRKYRSPPAEDRPIFGTAPYFGINLILFSGQSTIKAGDPVYVKYK